MSNLRKVAGHPLSVMALAVLLTLLFVEILFLNKSLRMKVQPITRWAHAVTAEDGNIQYDEKIGVRLSRTPGEIGYWTSKHGWVFKNALVGNNMGFSDPKDFSPEKEDSSVFRFIVMGDSFTANLYLQEAWPEVAHRELRDEGVEIYNMAIDGSGFPTWWRILKNVIIEQGFEVDAIVLAVCCDNMLRHHYWLSDTNYRDHGGAPKLSIFYERGDDYSMESVSTPDEEPALGSAWPIFEGELPDEDEMARHVLARHDWDYPFLASLIVPFVRDLFRASTDEESSETPFENDSFLAMVEDFRAFSEDHGVPIYGIDLDRAEHFETASKLIDLEDIATLQDLPGWSRRYSLPLDGHWNEEGARVVGEHLAPKLKRWAGR